MYPLSQIECPDLTWTFDLAEKKAFYSHQIFIRFEGTYKHWSEVFPKWTFLFLYSFYELFPLNLYYYHSMKIGKKGAGKNKNAPSKLFSIYFCYFRNIEIYFSSMNNWLHSDNHFLAGDRWFNVGVQIAKSISKETNTLTSEITFNCHRGYALIYDSTSMPPSELNLEKPIGK